MAGTTQSPRVSVRLAWERVDVYRGLVYIAIAGLVIGAGLVVFGLPPLDLHGPLHRNFGIMDPLCGGTRGVRYALLGQWGSAWAYNPITIPLVLGAAFLTVRHTVGKLAGKWINLYVRMPRWLLVTLIAALIIALEINQQLHADLLMAP